MVLEICSYIAALILFASSMYDWWANRFCRDEARAIRRLTVMLCIQSLLWLSIVFS